MGKWLVRVSVMGIAALFGTTACTSLRVHSDVNSALVHSVQCHTFAWAGSFRSSSPLRSTIANPLNENRLRSAIAAHLQSSGIQLATGNADCLVGYGIGARDVVEGAYPAGLGWGWGWPGPYAPGWGTYVYREGIIGVDLYDAKSKQPLWHATVNQDLYGAAGADAEKRINAAVDAIFKKYPT